MRSVTYLFHGLAIGLVAACGGNTVPVISDPDPDPDLFSFAEIADIAADVIDGYNDVDITAKSRVPLSGGATYAGAVGGEFLVGGRTTDVAGLMELDVDFRRDRVGGLVGNLVTREGDDIDGILSVRNGVLNRQSNSQQVAIFADVDGSLRSAAGENIRVDGRLRNAGFKGRDVRYVGGDIEADVNVDGRSGTLDLDVQLER